MPALLEFTLQTGQPKPRGLIGIPVHGLIFGALDLARPDLSGGLHAAEVKPFRLGALDWQQGDTESELRLQIGVLDDALTPVLLQALTLGTLLGQPEDTLQGRVTGARLLAQDDYSSLYSRAAQAASPREFRLRLLTPTLFRVTDMDMPFPLPKNVFHSLQRRWETFSDLHLGPDFSEWVGRTVRVESYRLWPKRVYFKGMRDAAMVGSVGEVVFRIVRPGPVEPSLLAMLAGYARYSGVGYKTAYGMGHVEVAGPEDKQSKSE